jgi:diguanylate cyclase (GGDEF)-like protein
VSTPLVFHVPSVIAMPFIGVLIATTGGTRSALVLTPLMLLVFSTYFYPPRMAIGYIAGCVVVLGMPLVYEADAVASGVVGQMWVSAVVYASVGGVVMLGKRQLLALRHAAQELSLRDTLTGLANRRALLEELERSSGDGFVLALADLNGFKHYNDTYGHAAGDSLLRRLGAKLAAACEDRGTAARLGGDEFCVLVPRGTDADDVRRLVEGALREEGHGFSISAACGVVSLPEEAQDTAAALRLADVRMYAAKPEARPSTDYLMSRVLLQMLEERHPGLGDHGQVVADLAASCAAVLGLAREDVEHVRRAAELHDIGKFAIPESIVGKPGPLDEEEWEFMRRHPVIGERVLVVVPSLQPVAALVRASHERWDGAGYPDRLAGDAIPVGARILAVADAFCAMTEERSYAPARSVEGALEELRKCAGTQFDPAVVEAFISVLPSLDAMRSPRLAA